MGFHTPVRRGRAAGLSGANTEDAGAETLLSGPKEPCNSPKASIIASRALERATLADEDCPTERSEMLDSVSNPTAITVSKIIKLRVTISAKPACRLVFRLVLMANGGGCGILVKPIMEYNVITNGNCVMWIILTLQTKALTATLMPALPVIDRTPASISKPIQASRETSSWGEMRAWSESWRNGNVAR